VEDVIQPFLHSRQIYAVLQPWYSQLI